MAKRQRILVAKNISDVNDIENKIVEKLTMLHSCSRSEAWTIYKRNRMFKDKIEEPLKVKHI